MVYVSEPGVLGSRGRPYAVCGTWGAAKRHRAEREPLDEACRNAERARDRERDARKRGVVLPPFKTGERGVCTWCGHLFTKRMARNRFCRERCRQAFMDRQRRGVLYMGWCLCCGVPVVAGKRQVAGLTCGPACYAVLQDARMPIPPAVRRAVTLRDEGFCWLCGMQVAPDVRWPDPWSASMDHVVPWSLGGSDAMDNLRLAHLLCNVRRGCAQSQS